MKNINKKIAITTLLGVVVMNTSAFAADPTTPIGAYTFKLTPGYDPTPDGINANAKVGLNSGIVKATQSGKTSITVTRGAGRDFATATADFVITFIRKDVTPTFNSNDLKDSYSMTELQTLPKISIDKKDHDGVVNYTFNENTSKATISDDGNLSIKNEGTMIIVATFAETPKYNKKIILSKKVTFTIVRSAITLKPNAGINANNVWDVDYNLADAIAVPK